MQAVQASLGESEGRYSGWGLLRPVMENLDRYRELVIDRAAMEAMLAEAAARARATADLLEGDAFADAVRRLPEALDLIRQALDGPVDLAHLEEVGRATEHPDLARLLDLARGRLDYEALCREVAGQAPAPAEVEEALSSVLETLRQLDEGEADLPTASSLLREERDLAEMARRQYEQDTYLAPEEWTADVALADELLTAGLSGRVSALTGLAGEPRPGEREPWLAALREAEWALVLVERLSQRNLT